MDDLVTKSVLVKHEGSVYEGTLAALTATHLKLSGVIEYFDEKAAHVKETLAGKSGKKIGTLYIPIDNSIVYEIAVK
jgi:hypothetical protein